MAKVVDNRGNRHLWNKKRRNFANPITGQRWFCLKLNKSTNTPFDDMQRESWKCSSWVEINKNIQEKRKEKKGVFLLHQRSRIFIMAGTDRFVITRRRHERRRHPWHPRWLNEPFLLFSRLLPPPYLCIFTPLDAARIISPSPVISSFCVSISPTLFFYIRLFFFLFYFMSFFFCFF